MVQPEEAPFPFNKLNGPAWLLIFAAFVALVMWASIVRLG